jgi:hypothetical protein
MPVRPGRFVLLAASAVIGLSACGAASSTGSPPTSQAVAASPPPSGPTLQVRRVVPSGIQRDGFATLVGTTSDPSILSEVRTDLAALPPFVSPGSSPCGATSCLVNCPVDFRILYELTITDAGGSVQERATLDAQGCRIADVSPNGGSRRLDDESSPLWTVVSRVLGVPRCTVFQPPVGIWTACHWPSGNAATTTAAP